ncbi:hypothetical protein [Robertkochia flava]|uniref:hypothetical protein n=1 Tax=Robertkochia flava TaxID=3447986 RepID=UPI001CD0044A|nr:hypothetical protein [Robertkochia marina]
MKTPNRLIVAALILFGLMLTSCAKVITLQVNADSLLTAENKDSLDLYASFKNQKKGETLETYTEEVKKGRIIKWKGKDLNNNYKISIEKIQYKSGDNPFPDKMEEIPYVKKWKARKKKIVKVKPVLVTGEDNCVYNLYFSIEKDGEKILDNILIDPELRIMQ